MFRSLSGRFLLLTVIFVMLAEVLIFVPSVARFREDYLQQKLDKALLASLAVLATDEMLDADLEAELLSNADVLNVVLRRNQTRQLVLSSPVPQQIAATYDLRGATALELIRDALTEIMQPQMRVIRVMGAPQMGSGELIEITVQTDTLRAALVDYGLRILALSAVISVMTAMLLFIVVRRVLVMPIKRVVTHMQSYAERPEDARRIIQPERGVTELYEAELALQSLQTELTGALRQKERLAQLGGAVAKISHDLRNILTTAQLFTDRVEMSEDPGVRRVVPKLVNSISRAVNLCESTLAFGKAEEPPPAMNRVALAPIVQDVIDSEQLEIGDYPLALDNDIPTGLVLRVDPEQLFRVLANLIRNARQAIVASGKDGKICVSASESDTGWTIEIRDTGPGLPPKARDTLFQAFQGSARKGGTGLGLVIASELVRGHGGHLELAETGEDGTVFRIFLPKALVPLDAAAA